MEVNSPHRKKLQKSQINQAGASTTDVFEGSNSYDPDSAMASKSLNQILPAKGDYEVEKDQPSAKKAPKQKAAK